MICLPGFDRVVALDTEFTPVVGGHPIPVCLVGHELISDTWIRLWHDEIGPTPPFPTDEKTLYVSYVASAESGFFLACGWPLPARVLDLHAEYRGLVNKALPKNHPGQPKTSLLNALEHFGIRHPYKHKADMQDLAIRGGPYTDTERQELLRYCEADVLVLAPLLERIVTHLRAQQRIPGGLRRGLGQALYRGRYMNTVAGMEYTGTPIDVPTLQRVRTHREEVIERLTEEGDRQYGVFPGGKFSDALLRKYLVGQGILDLWPRTGKRGYLRTDQDTMKEQARAHPQLATLRELLLLRGMLKDFPLAVGPDGRNRAELWGFGTATGRNAPSSAKFIFGPSTWMRGLIKPPEGRAIAYIDYSAEEIAIAAALSGDAELLKAVESGDPYLMFAYRAGLVPDNATKHTHKRERDICKVALLGMNYGMGIPSLAAGTGLSMVQAQNLHRQLKRTFDRFWEWSQQVINAGLLRRELWTYFGWHAAVVEGSKWTTLKNFPAQAHGAEILRLACCLIYERGIQLCCPVHDAVLIEAGADQIDEAVATTQRCMAEASRVVLNGFEIKTDAEIIRYPDRYMDPRGKDMWVLVTEVLDQLEHREPQNLGNLRNLLN